MSIQLLNFENKMKSFISDKRVVEKMRRRNAQRAWFTCTDYYYFIISLNLGLSQGINFDIKYIATNVFSSGRKNIIGVV